MNIPIILADFEKNQGISQSVMDSIQQDEVLRIELQNYFRNFPNHQFALSLLQAFITLRQTKHSALPIEDLMYAAYLLGLHQQIEDCLKIWEAKNLDFDTYAGLDIELMLFGGVDATLNFLELHPEPAAQKAQQYILKLVDTVQFDNLNDYFSLKLIPWYV
jgi:hypothetical protein